MDKASAPSVPALMVITWSQYAAVGFGYTSINIFFLCLLAGFCRSARV